MTMQLKNLMSSSEAQAEEQRKADEFRAQSKDYFDLVQQLEARSTASQISELTYLNPSTRMIIFLTHLIFKTKSMKRSRTG